MNYKMLRYIPVFILLFFNSFSFAEVIDIFAPSITSKHFLEISSKGTFLSYIEICSGGKSSEKYIEINSDKVKCYLISNPSTSCSILSGYKFELTNFQFGLFDIKENVLAYLDINFLQKLIYLFHKTGFRARITDAMRSPEKQIKYKRRGWSNVDASPHILGLAVDLVIYSGADREQIKKLSEILGLKFLYHGRGANRHVHVQDERQWQEMHRFDIVNISDSLNCFLKKFADKKDVYRVDSLSKGLDFACDFPVENFSSITFKVEDIYGEKTAEISSGIFEPGYYSVKLNFDYIKKGFYNINIYEGGKFITRKYYVKS